MLKSVISAFIFTTLCLCGFTQEKELIIKDIRVKFKELNDYKYNKKIVLENDEFIEHMTDGGGILTAYLRNDSVCKIYQWIGLSYGVLKIEYYYWQEKLIFAYRTEEMFNHIYFLANDTIELSEGEMYNLRLCCENRLYFNNDTLVEIKNKGDCFSGYETTAEILEAIQNDSKKCIRTIKTNL
jgi:hypothetical protein